MAQQLPSQIFIGRYFKDLLPSVSTHPDYAWSVVPLKTIRDCVEGSHIIKMAGQDYLPVPSQVDPTSKEQVARYKAYLHGAEFDGFPALSLRGWLGKMDIGSAQVELPDRMEYLAQNSDGDGQSLVSSIELAAANIMQSKFHVLVADYKGLSDVNLTELSLAEIEQINPQATIKQYTRENLVNWNYSRVDGKMQLSFVMLREVGTEFDQESMAHTVVDSYLILALDENGYYYQQKMVKGEKGARNYVTISGRRLKWLPVEVVADEELPIGCLPKAMGMLYPICEATLYRYRVSADYKEAMRYIVPTIMTKGWQAGDHEVFKEVNGGRDQMLLGAGVVNNLPGEVDYDVLAANTELMGFERYFDANSNKIKQMGGAVKTNVEAQRTATEAEIDAAELNAQLDTLASQLEQAFRRMVSYCAMFEGVWTPEQAELRLEDIVIGLPRDFANPKLSVEEARLLLDMITSGVRTREQVVRALASGGWDEQDAEQTMSQLDEEGPSVTELANAGQTS